MSILFSNSFAFFKNIFQSLRLFSKVYYASECSGAFFIGENMKITELADEYKQQYDVITGKIDKLRQQVEHGDFVGEDLYQARKKIATYESMAMDCFFMWCDLKNYYK